MGLFGGNSALKDAESILHDIDYRLLRVAWEEFVRFHYSAEEHRESEQFKVTTPAWVALEMVVNHKGKFAKFNEAELKFLKFLREGPQTYREVVELLSRINYTEQDAVLAFESHHDLPDVITPEFREYKSAEFINVLIDVATYYQQRLRDYVNAHGPEMDKALAQLG